jgi:hypothetical protein
MGSFPNTLEIKEAFEGYGYSEVDGWWVKLTGAETQRWRKASEGWICVEPIRYPFGGGDPMGIILPDMPGFMQVPHHQLLLPTSGSSHPASNPEHYEWIWPEDEIIFMYEFSNSLLPAGQTWQKVQDADGNITMSVVK